MEVANATGGGNTEAAPKGIVEELDEKIGDVAKKVQSDLFLDGDDDDLDDH